MTGSRRRGWRRRVALCGDDDLIVVPILHGLSVMGRLKGCILFVSVEYPWSLRSLRYILSIHFHHSNIVYVPRLELFAVS